MSLIWQIINPFPSKALSATSASYATSASWAPGGVGGITLVSNQTLVSESWAVSGSYYIYNYTNESISSTSLVNMTPYLESVSIVVAAELQPFIGTTTGTASVYAINEPSDDIIVDVVIFATS